MSRIGNRELVIPEGVTVNVQNSEVTVTGKKGNLNFKYKDGCRKIHPFFM